MKKEERRKRIKQLVGNHEVTTQEEIVEHLKKCGILATQATVSRDIKELGIIKVPLKDHTYRYELPQIDPSHIKLVEHNIREISYQDKLICLEVIPGSAAVVKRQIYDHLKEKVFCVLADDDTILVVVRDETEMHSIVEMIKYW